MPDPLAVITGASSGIGLAFARRLAPDHELLLIARRGDRLEEVGAELRARSRLGVSILAADLTDERQLAGVADRIRRESNLRLLINNAGFGYRGPFWQADLEVLDRMHRLHVTAALHLTHAALGVLVPQNRGAIINVASVAAFAQRAGSAGYGATKSWLATLTEGIYLDLKKANSAVVVQALCPGFTYSGFHDVMGEDRRRLAPPSMWLTAEQVVDASLRALPGGSLIVIPGWRYQWLVAALRSLPMWLKLRLEAAHTRDARRPEGPDRSGPPTRS